MDRENFSYCLAGIFKKVDRSIFVNREILIEESGREGFGFLLDLYLHFYYQEEKQSNLATILLHNFVFRDLSIL